MFPQLTYVPICDADLWTFTAYLPELISAQVS
jgi:hypothetical protein